jgi:hypothetical protein
LIALYIPSHPTIDSSSNTVEKEEKEEVEEYGHYQAYRPKTLRAGTLKTSAHGPMRRRRLTYRLTCSESTVLALPSTH